MLPLRKKLGCQPSGKFDRKAGVIEYELRIDGYKNVVRRRATCFSFSGINTNISTANPPPYKPSVLPYTDKRTLGSQINFSYPHHHLRTSTSTSTSKMKFAAATTLLFATLALASPAPVAQPEADAAPALAPALAPEIDARAASILDSREPKKGKSGSSGSSSNSTEEGAAGIIAPSRVLELGALGLGLMEVVRLWG